MRQLVVERGIFAIICFAILLQYYSVNYLCTLFLSVIYNIAKLAWSYIIKRSCF